MLALMLALASANAPADNFQLEWEAPPECPPASALRAETQRILGRDPGQGSDLVRARARVEREVERFSLTLEISTPAGGTQKTMSAQRCATLVDAAALVIAVTVDPLAALEAPPKEPEPEPEPPSPAAPSTSEDDEAPAEPPQRTRTYLGLAPALEGSALPGVGPGFSLSFGVRPKGPWRAEAFGTAWYPRRQRFDAGGASLWMWTAGVRLCAQPSLGPVELPACVAGEGGQMRGVGLDLDQDARAIQPWAALLVGPGLEWPFHPRVRLVAAVDLVAILVRPGFAIEGQGEVFRVPKAGVRGLLGLEFTLSGVE